MRHPVPSGEERASAGNSAPDHVPIGMLDFGTRLRVALNSPRGLCLPWDAIALRAGVSASTLYQGVMDPCRQISVEVGARVARAFPEAVNVLAGYFLPVGHAIHRIAVAPAGDLRGWFARQAEDLGRLAGAYLEAVRDGRVDAEEALDLLALSAALRGQVDALEAAIREGAVA